MICSAGECVGRTAVALETSAVNPKALFGVSSTVHVHGNSTMALAFVKDQNWVCLQLKVQKETGD